MIIKKFGIFMKNALIFILGTTCTAHAQNLPTPEITPAIGEMRLNELQYIGTHNSYHIAPNAGLQTLIRLLEYKSNGDWPADKLLIALDYTHPPLSTQLELGIRQFELDLHHDPKGGKFANPGALRVLQKSDIPSAISYDWASDLKKPGFKVFHGGVDVESTCLLFTKCLKEIDNWSKANPGHFPIIIHIEAKEGGKPALGNAYNVISEPNFDLNAWTDLEREILSVFDISKIITPKDITGAHSGLRKAIRKDGWPKLKDASGKVMFLLLNKKDPTNRYEKIRGQLKNQLFFTNVGDNNTNTGWLRVPDPKYADNKRFIRSNFMISTMADVHTLHARTNDTSRREDAFSSGAHFILTDYPIPDRRYSNYQVRFGPNLYVRCNPVTFSGPCPF